MQEKSLNLMLALIMLVAIIFTWSKTSQAALEIVEDAFEVEVRQVEWPTYDQGRLVVHPCSNCESVTLTANEETRYFLGFSGPRLSRQEFISKANSQRNSKNSVVYLFYRPENNQLTRIVLDLGPK